MSQTKSQTLALTQLKMLICPYPRQSLRVHVLLCLPFLFLSVLLSLSLRLSPMCSVQAASPEMQGYPNPASPQPPPRPSISHSSRWTIFPSYLCRTVVTAHGGMTSQPYSYVSETNCLVLDETCLTSITAQSCLEHLALPFHPARPPSTRSLTLSFVVNHKRT